MAAIAILIVGAAAALYCYSRLAQLLPMQDASAVKRADAVVTAVHTPMVKKTGTTSDVNNEVRFQFEVNGKRHEGFYSIRGRDKAPEVGAKEPVAYYTAQPSIFLRAAEYDDLPRQLMALRVMMAIFALAAMILPFFVMHHRAA